MKNGPFKLKSGNKPSIAKLTGAPLKMKEPTKKMKPKVGEVIGSHTAKFTKKKKKSKFDFKKTRDFSKIADYSKKAMDYRKYSNPEKYGDDRN